VSAPSAAPRGARALLEVEGLTVRTAQEQLLVHDVGFTLDRGEVMGLVGESGSGKSLTAKAIVGLLPRELRAQGAVALEGEALLGARERALRAIRGSRISLLLQDPFTMLNPLQTVGVHIAESLRGPRDRARTEREIARRLEEVGLDAAVARRHPFELSGGMAQRAAIAAALAGDPDLLIVDEPTTALDVTNQERVLRLLAALRRGRGMALMLITHDLDVAAAICDRMVVMYAGSVVENAPAPALLAAPRHPYSLGLLLSRPPLSAYTEQLRFIPGNVPKASAVTDRCPFAARCRWQQDRCIAGRPPLDPLDPAHLVRCVRAGEIAGELRRELDAAVAPAAPPPPPEGAPVARVQEAVKTYRSASGRRGGDATHALRGVSFEIVEGECLGLVGESGSGKTTIAKALVGLTRVDGGRVELAGLDVSDYGALGRAERTAARRAVQVVFQNPYASLNPAMSVGAALREALAVRDPSAAGAAEAERLLARVGLPGAYARCRPAALSGGERQRVAIARALAVRPRLLICDEPVASLDVSIQAQILELLREIRRSEGTSLLFISHDLSVVRQMADRIVVLYRGEVVEEGPAGAVLDTPRHEYTRTLLASSASHTGITDRRRS